MRTYYKATFSDGTVLTRSAASRKYTHAYLSRGKYERINPSYWPGVGGWRRDGFCGSERLARKALGNRDYFDPKYYTNVNFEISEIAPAVEITRAEYKTISNPTGHLGARAR